MGRYPRLLNFPRALSPKQSRVCMSAGGIICASLPLFHLLRLQHRMEEIPPFSHLQNCKYSSCVLQIRTGHCLVFLAVCFPSWNFNVAREALLGSPARPAVPCTFPSMHPTCLIPCAALSSCTAVFSRIPFQQLHFLVQWHCWMEQALQAPSSSH